MAESTTSAATTVAVVAAPTTESFFKQHERLIIIVLLVALTAFIGNKWINHSADVATQKATLAQTQLADQKDKDNQLAQQVAASTAQYTQLIAQLSQQNAQLTASIAQRNTTLVSQQASDQKATDAQLLARLKQIAPNLVPAVTPDAGGVQVTQQGARDAVSDLEEIPVLQKNLAATQQEVSNDQKELIQANQLNSQLNTEITGLNTQIVDEQNTCKSELAAASAEAKKGKLKWFKIGAGVGFVAGLFVGHGV